MTLSTLLGLTGISLFLAASLLRLLLLVKINKVSAYWITALGFIITFIPLDGHTLNQYLRGLFNDLSITSIVLLLIYQFKPEEPAGENTPVFLAIFLTGLFFYPASLGLGPLDPYAAGFIKHPYGSYTPLLFTGLLFLLMVLAFRKHYDRLLLCLVLAIVSFHAGLLESNNLWDYLLDPLIYFYALFSLIFQWLARLSQTKSSSH